MKEPVIRITGGWFLDNNEPERGEKTQAPAVCCDRCHPGRLSSENRGPSADEGHAHDVGIEDQSVSAPECERCAPLLIRSETGIPRFPGGHCTHVGCDEHVGSWILGGAGADNYGCYIGPSTLRTTRDGFALLVLRANTVGSLSPMGSVDTQPD